VRKKRTRVHRSQVELTSSYKPVNWNYYKLGEFEISQSLFMILVVIHCPKI
jgi:hypothetical protein